MTDRHELRDVRRTFDRIAPHFSKTRERPWPAVERFIRTHEGDTALDLGCGNGRHAELLAARVASVIGLDLSRGQLEQARTRARDRDFELDLLQGEVTELPIRSGCVDIAVYIATIHHLSSVGLRRRSLDELGRVLAPNGRALVSAWSVTHDRFDRTHGFDTVVEWTLPSGETVDRFYHVYDLTEFRTDLSVASLECVDVFEEAGNCYGVVGPPEQ